MTQAKRIERMEQILDEAEEVVSALAEALERYAACEPALRELEAYYTSELWKRDFEADCNRKLPQGLKRGVLSEDAVFNLLQKEDELRAMLRSCRMG